MGFRLTPDRVCLVDRVGSALCDRIETVGLRDGCYAAIGQKTANTALCDKILDPGLRSICSGDPVMVDTTQREQSALKLGLGEEEADAIEAFNPRFEARTTQDYSPTIRADAVNNDRQPFMLRLDANHDGTADAHQVGAGFTLAFPFRERTMSKSRFLGLLLLAFACALSLPAAQPGEWRTYHNEKSGYELEYPAGWNVIEARPRTDDKSHWAGDVLSPGVFQKVTFQEPEGKLWPGEFVVLVREHVEGRTLDEWADTNYTDVHDESLVTGAEDTLLAGRAARLFRVFGFDHTAIVMAFVLEGRVYQISYTGSTPNDPDLAEHVSIYEHMKQSFRLVPAIETEVFDLGGPCDDGESSSIPDFHAKLREAAQHGDHQQMIDLQKQYVRAMCSNQHRWYGLAETYLDADRSGMAIQVLHELHRRGAEIKPSTLRHQENLAELIDTPEFQRSELGRELRGLRMVAARRKDVYRTQLEALDASARPPQRYVARGACPFECCSYREWDVLEKTPLYDAPFGTVVVGSAVKAHRVKGVTGDVHLRPAPVAVVHDRSPFNREEIIFVLDYLGEGFYRYWRTGEIAEEELWIDDVCLRPSRDCWAEYIQAPEDRQEPQWWILIETDEGVRGWTNRSEHFGNKDACG